MQRPRLKRHAGYSDMTGPNHPMDTESIATAQPSH